MPVSLLCRVCDHVFAWGTGLEPPPHGVRVLPHGVAVSTSGGSVWVCGRPTRQAHLHRVVHDDVRTAAWYRAVAYRARRWFAP